MLFFRQIAVLVRKDLLLLFNPKRRTSTIWRAYIIPIVFAAYMAFILRVYWPKEEYGIATANPVRSLPEALHAAGGGRNTLVLVNSIASGGDIDRVIQLLTQEVNSTGIVEVVTHPEELVEKCRSTLQGTTKCFGAVVFNSSPKEGPWKIWNYTLRADSSFGLNIDVLKSTNDVEVYQIPLQHAVDTAIASVNSTGTSASLPRHVNEYLFTSMTQKEWKDKITTDIQTATTNYLSVVWLIGFVGVMYQLVGLMAKEREMGIADLMESMMPNPRRCEPQLARLIAHHLAFTITYGPGWIIMAIIAKLGLFPHTSGGIIIVSFIIAGLALTSYSIFGATFFRKAQLSGISTVVISLALGIVAQVLAKKMSSGTVVVLALLFNPMAFVFFFISISKWERKSLAANLTSSSPENHWPLPGIVLLVILIVHTFVYPALAIYLERLLYGTASRRSRRHVSWKEDTSATAVRLNGFNKVYQKNIFLRILSSIFRRKLHSVVAVDHMSLSALKGQILVLVGPNGCGKTTILNSIAGLNRVSGGSIALDGSGGIGLCPQKNVLWNSLTVEQHATIFYTLKANTPTRSSDDVNNLIRICGLEDKRHSPARTLSGGQKRKLQLIMMLTGGSKVCCVDEVSGGLDPLSRRRVWDILVGERGHRTFILTTHFLDEAEYLADHMVIISKGQLKAEGSTSELKTRLGNGYRFSIPPGNENLHGTEGQGLSNKLHAEQKFHTPDSQEALGRIKSYQKEGIKNYQIAGPTIEEVFMRLTRDTSDMPDLKDHPREDDTLNFKSHDDHQPEKNSASDDITEKHHDTALLTGHRTSSLRQALILFQKRLKVLRWNWIAYLATIGIPIVAAALTSLLLKNLKNPGCGFMDQIAISDIQNLSTELKPQLLIGPPTALTPQKLELFLPSVTSVTNTTALIDSIHMVSSLDEFNEFTNSNYTTIVPGGLFLGTANSRPTFNYRSNVGILGVYSAIFMQNALDVMLSNQTIVTQYAVFDIPWPTKTMDALQFIFYFGLVMAAYPAFFALYPTMERLRGVRALQYSNGVRSLPLWLAYLIFDALIVLFVSVIVTIIFVTAVPDSWYYLGALFVCIFLYGIASILLSYTISLVSKSQLSAFAFSAGGQAFMLLMYTTGFMNITVRSPAAAMSSDLVTLHFTLGLITPIGQLIRALFVGLNTLSIDCTGLPPTKSTNPGAMTLYGGPIVYLIGQSLFLFGILIWHDHRFSFHKRSKPRAQEPHEETTTHEPEVSREIYRVNNSEDGLKVQHISKSFNSSTFGKITAVDDLTFGVKSGEVFALVGPNGAGKSTTISILRGELKPARGYGSIFVQNISITHDRDAARSHLGVCPQQDAMDQMTVMEHLKFYARVRGVNDIDKNVRALVNAVGLRPFADRMGSKLSGGNQRKLSLAIALIGNPEVLLLDEPSSGMDPLAKRSMWKTLSRFVPHRSILLTTHSMEEADALADRVGVLSKHLLDIGTTSHLRRKYGHGFHIHLVLSSAPQSTVEEANIVKEWILKHLPGAEIERQPYHGQLRFNIPSVPSPAASTDEGGETSEDEISVGSLFMLLEENKEKLGLAFHSVSPSTFDEVFLKVVQKHGIGEEDLQVRKRKWWESDLTFWRK